ncbi:MAG: hypothetical protein ACTSRP_23575 [Candidatus Helarchaeota archaeon]
MKINKGYHILIILILSVLFTISLSQNFIQRDFLMKDENIGLTSNYLGDFSRNITTPINCTTLTYLNGYIWAVNLDNPKQIYQLNPSTGAEKLHLTLSFDVNSICNDGTYLYVSVGVLNNNTIYKLDISGTILSNIKITNISIPTPYAINGLLWLNNYLWAAFASSSEFHLYRVDPGTGIAKLKLVLPDRISGLTYYGGFIWGVADFSNAIYAIDINTGEFVEWFPVGSGVGDWGITCNSTHFILSDYNNEKLMFTRIPTKQGEVFVKYA